MCTGSCLQFIADHLSAEEVRGKSCLEVGSLDVNGSARSLVTRFQPALYLGVDMQAGPGVDEVCGAEGLIPRFGLCSFDVVISTEMLEHVLDWRAVLHNLKGVLKPGGLMLITTRSFGFGYHAYPFDFWRYELEDMRTLFLDFDLHELLEDPVSPGVFVKAKKPCGFIESNLQDVALYSMVVRRRAANVTKQDIERFQRRRRILQPLREVERSVRQIRKRMIGK
jgi:SAM-dependent methyltransferase